MFEGGLRVFVCFFFKYLRLRGETARDVPHSKERLQVRGTWRASFLCWELLSNGQRGGDITNVKEVSRTQGYETG